jgi:hypothetical protein
MVRYIPKHGRAFNGISVLDLPKNMRTLRKGVKVIYERPTQHVGIIKQRRGLADQKKDPDTDMSTLVKGLQKLLRVQKTHESQKPDMTGFQQSRPIR